MIKFKSEYFDTNKNAVHVNDTEVQEMIDEVLENLIASKEKTDFCFQATGSACPLWDFLRWNGTSHRCIPPVFCPPVHL